MPSLPRLAAVLVTAALAAFLQGPAHAAVVSYDESVSGDIDASSFTLGIGANTIAGTTSIDAGGVADYDDIRFVVGAGTELLSLSVSAALRGGPSLPLAWEVFTEGFGAGSSLGEFGGFAPFSTSLAGVPLAAGDYFLYQFDLAGEPQALAGYTLRFDVRELQSIPEPGTLALVALALGAIGFTAMRRRAG